MCRGSLSRVHDDTDEIGGQAHEVANLYYSLRFLVFPFLSRCMFEP
jgi:hypothetical protein